MKKVFKIAGGIVLGLVFLVFLVFGTVHVVLNNGGVLKGLVDKFGAEYIDGDIAFSNVKGSVLRSFPFFNIEIDDFALTYPHERYASWDSVYVERSRRRSMLKAGYGREEPVDTLASFRRLEVSLNYMSLIRGGSIDIPRAELSHPRIFAHYYDSTAASWDILPIGTNKDPDDTTSSPLPRIKVRHVALTEKPYVVFTNPVDTLLASVRMNQMILDGNMDTEDLEGSNLSLSVDSLRVAGRLPADTLMLRLNYLGADYAARHIGLVVDANANIRTGSVGRMRLPIGVVAEGSIPKREDSALEVRLDTLQMRVAALKMDGSGDVVTDQGRTYIKAAVGVDRCPLGEVIDQFGENFPVLKKIRTDASLTVKAKADGYYDSATGSIPAIDARVYIPDSYLDYEDLGHAGRISLNATAVTDSLMKLDASVRRLVVAMAGVKVDANGRVRDLVGKDPYLTVDGTVTARADSVARLLLAERGITGSGRLDGDIHLRSRLSQLNLAKIGGADVNCRIDISGLDVQDEPDSLDAYIRAATLLLHTKGNQIDTNMHQGARVLTLEADIDSLRAVKGAMYVKGGDIHLKAQNSAAILSGGKELTPLMGILKAGRVSLRDGSDTALELRRSTETFRIIPSKGGSAGEKFSLTSDSERLRVRSGTDAVAIRSLKFDVNAARRVRGQNAAGNARRRHFLDSLQRVYPGVPEDSLLAIARRNRALPSWMREESFSAKDIQFNLSDALMQYYRDWNLDGNLYLRRANFLVPKFPLRSRADNLSASFNNNEVSVKSLSLKAGESDLSAKVKLSGLRRALLRRGTITMDAALTSEFIDVGELLRAYAYYTSAKEPELSEDATDEEIEAAISSVELPDSTTAESSKLIVVPGNLEANVTVESTGIKYNDFMISWASTELAMKQRTLQITNTVASTNVGDVNFEGFYSTQAKDDIKAGFDLSLVDITAEKVIAMMPAVDSLLPILRSFGGDLTCEIAATADIDTTMSVVIPSLDGIVRISGENLRLEESEEFTKIAKLLMFKNKKKAYVDSMYVYGMVRDNTLELFPFILNVDRYLLAASGVQHFDESFNYHLSVIKSPLLVKLGLNAWGSDFKHIKYSVGSPLYRSPNVPVFTKQIDTVHYSLLASIHNIFDIGVERAIAQNQQQNYIRNGQRAEGYSFPTDTAAVSSVLDSLRAMQAILGDGNLEETDLDRLRDEVVKLEEEAAERNREAKREDDDEQL